MSIKSSNEPFLEIAPRDIQTAHLIHRLRADPEVEKHSFHQKPQSFDEFYQTWPSYFQIPELPMLLIRLQSDAVGYISFRPTKSGIEVSIALDKSVRNRGIGKKSLKKALAFAASQQIPSLEAYIFHGNEASIKIFEQLGFIAEGDVLYEKWSVEGVKTHNVIRYILQLHTRQLHKQQRTFIIAEIGSNWRLGTLKNDIKLIETYAHLAKEAGADAIKFQTFHPERLYAKGAGTSGYLTQAGTKEEMQSLFSKLMMPHEIIKTIAEICEATGIEFMSTPFSEVDFDAVNPFVSRHKIASYELSHLHILRRAKAAKKPIYLSTGASNIYEINWALQQLQGADVTLLQCTAAYPAVDSAVNLATLKTLAHAFQLPVGISDHSLDPFTAPIAAVALGATVIEKHVTLDRRLPGPDHSFAITFEELCEMVKRIREVELMGGTRCKVPTAEELELYYFAKRRIQATCFIAKGEKITLDDNCAILRPGNQRQGVHPSQIASVEGMRALKDITEGEGIRLEYVQ